MAYKDEPEFDSPKSTDHKSIIDYLCTSEETDLARGDLQESANFRRLLAQYKGKVLEKYAHLFR